MKNVVIGGGTGFIGRNLHKLLSNTGYNVTIISRMPGHKHMSWHDLDNAGLPADTHAVINLAGQNVLDPTRRWTPGFKQNVWNSRINSAKSLVRAIQLFKQKPNVFINVSGVSLYRPDEKKIYTELDSGENYDFMSKLCLAWEEAATLPADLSNIRQIKLRTGVVIGRSGGMIKSLRVPFMFGVGGPIGDGKQPLPWIHIDDLCRFIKYSIEENQMSGVYNTVAPDIITNREFTKAFAWAMFRPALIPLPTVAVDLIFGTERSVLLKTGARIEPKLIKESGFSYQYPTISEACTEVCSRKKAGI